MTPEEMKSKMEPTADQELSTDAELRDSVTQEVTDKGEATPEKLAKDRANDPKAAKEYTFPFKFVDASGKDWSGDFTTKILSIHDRQRVGILRAQLGGGLPVESLDALTVELNLMIAHLTFSLTARPDWAKSLRDLSVFPVVQSLYAEVASHEAFFLGWPEN